MASGCLRRFKRKSLIGGDTLSYGYVMPKPKKTRAKKESLTEVVSMRLSANDVDRLDEVYKRMPFLARLSIARYALRIGLMTMQKDGFEAGTVLKRAADH